MTLYHQGRMFAEIHVNANPGLQVNQKGFSLVVIFVVLDYSTDSKLKDKQYKAWRMVPGRFRGSEIFDPISKTRRRFE